MIGRRLLRVPGFAMWALLASAPVKADDSLSDIRRMLAKNSVICADFIQTKSLRALTRPLVSKGRLVFVSGKGVLWQVLEPFATKVLVKSDALIKWDDQGVAQRLSFGQAPVYRSLSQVFLAVFTGDINRLRETFEITSNVSHAHWRLTLIPRSPGLAAIIAAVRVSGGRFVDELLIKEKAGDRTLIRFSGMNANACRLGKVEKGYFAH